MKALTSKAGNRGKGQLSILRKKKFASCIIYRKCVGRIVHMTTACPILQSKEEFLFIFIGAVSEYIIQDWSLIDECLTIGDE